ncbi:arginase family protein [Pseudenhygromyxa sp. WMMC2535]|uniref:arginase family protein n=1 Tax=Pseudenhygromyxa sp. WMMC2535 TaxID=2712867 RepID=UPI001555030D|nr:arginase family protein [Pseudenhygromyxa sp. WMMC2535]NVB39898.1 arginase family protein [Pseudenhygromyxa sp. WMMC2535]
MSASALAASDRDALLDELACYLRPPGQGIHAVSTGRAELLEKTRAYLGPAWDPDAAWRDHLASALGDPASLPAVALLAIPSDTGAGIVRGAARGPEAIRAALGQAPVLDLGDVFSIPQLLGEDMLGEDQRARCQDALWPELPLARRRALAVSPLGMARRARALLLALAPDLRVMMLGGDHTVTWPVLAPLLEVEGDELEAGVRDIGVVHFDAHTDLLPERLGIEHCFATWAYHANEALGRGQRLLQLGIRASGRDRGHWEEHLGVRQIWAEEAKALTPQALAAEVGAHMRARGVRRIYISNDIDGTDARWAAACGTPEPGGLEPEQVVAVIDALGQEFAVFGADLVELAPGLSLDREASARSVEVATRYVRASLAALTGKKERE